MPELTNGQWAFSLPKSSSRFIICIRLFLSEKDGVERCGLLKWQVKSSLLSSEIDHSPCMFGADCLKHVQFEAVQTLL